MVPTDDRGFLYGDGVFETVRLIQGRLVLWSQHLQRLRRGCQLLRLQPDWASIEALPEFLFTKLANQSATAADAIVKLQLTRREGLGYQPRLDACPRETLIIRPYVRPASVLYRDGVSARTLHWRLPRDPQWQGCKHLNRLAQVQCAAELAPGEFDGLVFDFEDCLIEGTRSNIVLLWGGEWVTPELMGAGVDGVLRQWLLGSWGGPQFPPGWLKEKPVMRHMLCEVRAAAFCNSVFGIVPIAAIDGRPLDIRPITEGLQPLVHQQLELPT